MGRAKLKMELIEKEKSRMVTFKKRKDGLTKKLHELTTLCGVPACMIVYDPTTNESSIWPPQQDSGDGEFRRLIDAYKRRNKDLGGVRPYTLHDFFVDRQKHVDAELIKQRKRNLEAKFPTWHDSLCFMDESQLRNFAAALRGKAAAVRARIDFLKNVMLFNYPKLGNFQFHGFEAQGISVMDVVGRNSEELPVSVPNYYYAPPPMQVQPYVLRSYSSMEENVNWWADNGDDITRYLLH